MSDWECVTPRTDARGRVLTFEERMQHAARMIGRFNDQALETFIAELERNSNISAELRHACVRKAAEYLIQSTATALLRIAEDLALEHAAGPFAPRSTEIH